jgi:hypothetical protein
MTMQFRRLAVVSLTALALVTGAAATAVSAPAQPVRTAHQPTADGIDGYPGSGHGPKRPLHFGPFEIPRHGTVSSGFSWAMED